MQGQDRDRLVPAEMAKSLLSRAKREFVYFS
jgi:hypothetical protein